MADKDEIDINDLLQQMREAQEDARIRQEEFSEAKWEALSKEDQLLIFCAVMRRLSKGELEDARSYRGVLYDAFGFGPESYAPAMNAGFLALHNSIYRRDELEKAIVEWAKDKEISGSAINDLLSKLETI